jgi:hypothetical protein
VKTVMTKTLDRYFPAVAEGIDCRVRIYAPDDPTLSYIVLMSWIPRPPTEMLEPFLSEFAAAFREGIQEMAGCHNLEDFSLVEHHALQGENERFGLIVYVDSTGTAPFWQMLERETLEFITGESADALAGLPESHPIPKGVAFNDLTEFYPGSGALERLL